MSLKLESSFELLSGSDFCKLFLVVDLHEQFSSIKEHPAEVSFLDVPTYWALVLPHKTIWVCLNCVWFLC